MKMRFLSIAPAGFRERLSNFSARSVRSTIATFCRGRRGMVAVEAAFAFPIAIIAFMIVIEFVNMALTIQVAENAVSASLVRFRDEGLLGPSAENDIKQGVAAYSYGYIEPSEVRRVTVEAYDSLDAMGNPGGSDASDDEDEEDAGDSFEDAYPAWHIVVVVRKDFITPLPALLLTDRHDFTYRYERVLSYLPNVEESED